MTAAISVARHEGAEAVVCASTGNTSASMAAYAAKAGLTPLVLVPEGKIAAGKMAQAIVHGARIIMVRGNFDHCLQMARGLSENYPVALVNSVNPVRLQGQKTASFEIVDFLGDAPDVHVLPVGNAGNISAYWLGYRQYADLGRATRRAGDAGLPGGRCRAAGPRRARRRPGDQGHRDPGRQPRVVDTRRRGPGRVRRPLRLGHRRPDPLRPARARVAATASSSSRRRPPASPGCCRTSSRASRTPGSASSSPSPVTASRTPPPRSRVSAGWSTPSSTPTSTRRPAPPGSLRHDASSTDRSRSPSRPPRPTSDRATTRSAWRWRCATGWSARSSATGRSSRSRARAPPTYRATRRTWWSGRCTLAFDEMGERPPGLRLTCTNAIPHARGLGSSSAAIVGGHRPGPRPGRGRHAAARRRRRVPARRPARGPPRQRRPRLVRRLRGQRPRRPGRLLGRPVLRRPAGLGRRASCRRRGCRPRRPAGCCPRRCRTPTPRPTPVGPRCWSPHSRDAPSTCCSPPATCSTRTTGGRRCRPASTWSRRCAPAGPPPSSRAPGRPCSRSAPTATSTRSSPQAPEGWRARPLDLDRDGRPVS